VQTDIDSYKNMQ